MNYICILHVMNYTAIPFKMQDFFSSKLRQKYDKNSFHYSLPRTAAPHAHCSQPEQPLIPAPQSICQSIGSTPFALRKSFVWLKGLLPKNPRNADSGLG